MAKKSETRDAALVLAELAHELRQPLTGIRASAELLLESNPDPAVRARVTTILRQAERIQALVERARREGPPAGARGDLHQAIDAAWSLLEAEAEKQGATLVRSLSPAVPKVTADPIALEQIFGNLLRNAVEAVAGKGGRIRVSTAPVAGGAEAIVEDDGPGVPESVRSRIFGRSVTGRAQGTGLGLYISRSLAAQAGGALELLEGGRGARFRLRLPAAR